MNTYFWTNENDKDEIGINIYELFGMESKYTSGEHSGGAVVMAENKDEAVALLMEDIGFKTEKAKQYLLETINLFEKEKGVVYFGDGNC